MILGQSTEGCSKRQLEFIRQLLLQGYLVKIGETGLTIYRLEGVDVFQRELGEIENENSVDDES